MEFDVIIPVAANDVQYLGRTLPYIKKYIHCRRIVVIGEAKILRQIPKGYQITFLDENSLLEGLSLYKIKQQIMDRYPKAERRAGWYFQQFLKWGYARYTETPYYLSWDVDTIPLKRIDFFDINGRPYFDVLPFVHQDMIYGHTMKKLWPDTEIRKNSKCSFITEHMMFDKIIMEQLLDEIESNNNGHLFSDIIIDAVPKKNLNLSGFSEFETYAAYVQYRYNGRYEIRDWHNLRHGKVFFGNHPTVVQLKRVAAYFDAISFEDFDYQWPLCKYLCSDVSKIDFYKVYMNLKPFIDFYYAARMKVRELIKK